MNRPFRVLLPVTIAAMLAVAACTDRTRNLPPTTWAIRRLQMPANTLSPNYPTPPETPHVCSARPLIPYDLQKKSGFRQFSVVLDAPSDTVPITLKSDDLRLFAGTQEIPISQVLREPATVGVMVDTSGSMGLPASVLGPYGPYFGLPIFNPSHRPAPTERVTQAASAIRQFITKLDPADDVFLYAFNSQPYLVQPLTFDHQSAVRQLALLHASGESAIYDSLIRGIETLEKGCERQKALLLISDGVDNSSFHLRGDLVSAAQHLNARIFAIGVGNPVERPSFASLAMNENDYVDAENLSDLAQRTGGRFYLLPAAGDQDQVNKDAAAIAAAIANRYAVVFFATRNIRSLRLEIRKHPGATLKVEGLPITVSAADGPGPR